MNLNPLVTQIRTKRLTRLSEQLENKVSFKVRFYVESNVRLQIWRRFSAVVRIPVLNVLNGIYPTGVFPRT